MERFSWSILVGPMQSQKYLQEEARTVRIREDVTTETEGRERELKVLHCWL